MCIIKLFRSGHTTRAEFHDEEQKSSHKLKLLSVHNSGQKVNKKGTSSSKSAELNSASGFTQNIFSRFTSELIRKREAKEAKKALKSIQEIFSDTSVLKLENIGPSVSRIQNTDSNDPKPYLGELKHVYLNGNSLTETHFTELLNNLMLNREELLTLELQNNKIKFLPPELTQFKKLSHLSLKNNKIETVPNLTYFKKLESVDLSGNPIKNIDPDNLPTSLRFLKLGKILNTNDLKNITQKLQKAGFSIETISHGSIFLDPEQHEKNKSLNALLNKLKEKAVKTGILDFTGVKDENFINSNLLSNTLFGCNFHKVILSHCNLTSFPTGLFRSNSEQVLSLQLDGNPHLTKLPENMGEKFPNLTHLDISETRIDDIYIIEDLISKKLRLVNLSKTPLETNKNTWISNLRDQKFKVTSYKEDGSLKILSREDQALDALIRRQRDAIIYSGAELIEPHFSQMKGHFRTDIPYGICAPISTSAAVTFLEENGITGFLEKIYSDASEQGKGKPDPLFLGHLIQLRDNTDTISKAQEYLKQDNIEYNPVISFSGAEEGVEGYSKSIVKRFATWLQSDALNTTETRAINVKLLYEKEKWGHRIAFLSSGEKNDKGEKALYFLEPNLGLFKIWLKEDSDVLANALLSYYSNTIPQPSEFQVIEVKKNNK